MNKSYYIEKVFLIIIWENPDLFFFKKLSDFTNIDDLEIKCS